MKLTSYSTHQLLVVLVTAVMTGIGTAKAEEMAVTVTNDNFQHFSEVYNAVGSVDWFSAVCAKEAPESATQHQDVIANLVSDERLGQIRAILDATLQAQPGIKADVDAGLDRQLAMLQRSLGHSMSIFCQQRFEALVVPHTDVLMDVSALSPTLPPLPTKALEADAAQDGAEPREADLSGDDDEAADQPEIVTITNGNFERFAEVHKSIGMFDRISSFCGDLVSDRIATHVVVGNEVAGRHSVGEIRRIVEATVSAQPEIEADLANALDGSMARMEEAITTAPYLCGDGFETTMTAVAKDLPDVATFMEGLAADMQNGGAIASQDVAATDVAVTGALPMPVALGESMEALPGLYWQVPDDVRANNAFRAMCVWRCSVFKYGNEAFPFLTVHEAVPLSAEEAINEVLAPYDYPIAEQQDFDGTDFLGRTAMQASRLIVRHVYLQDIAKQDLRWIFAFEKNGLTVIAELFYPGGSGLSRTSTESNALVNLITTLEMDVEAVHASLLTPVVTIERPSSDTPPTPDQVIYAEDPSIVYSTRLVGSYDGPVTSFQFDADTRTMDKSVLDSQGPELEIDGEIYQYMPRLLDGTLIEGIFESPYRYEAFDITFDLLNGQRLAFNRQGRFGLVSNRDFYDGLVSIDNFSRDIGTYHINGYTIELRSDNGAVRQELFFSYGQKINLAGKVMYPISDTE